MTNGEMKGTTTNSTKVVKAGAGYVIGNYLLKGITFLSAPIFTRLLTTADFGEYNTYLSYEAIIYILVGLALHSSINNAKIEYGKKLDSYVSAIVTFMLLSAVIWIVGANLLFEFYKGRFGFDRVIANLLIIHCLSSSLLQVFNVYISLTYSVGSFLKVTAFNGIANIAFSALLILTFFSEERCTGRIVGTVIPMALVGIYVVVFFFKKSVPKVNWEYWKYGLVYSLPIVPHGISQVILSSFDRIMIKDMVGASEAGIYSFAYVIYSLFRVATTSLENVWKPWVYEKMEAKEFNSIRTQGSKYALGMGIFTVLVMLGAPELIKIFGDREYWGCTPCVVPVILGGFFSFLYTLPSLVEYYYKKTKFIAIGTMTAAVVNILLNYFFIKKYGYIAAAYTTLVTYLLYFAFHYFLACKIHGGNVFCTRDIMLISAGVIFAGFVVLFIEKMWVVRWVLIIVVSVLTLWWCEKEFAVVTKFMARIKNGKN